MDVSLDPPQAPEVVEAVAAALAPAAPAPDPWWQAGVAENLGPDVPGAAVHAFI